MLNSQSVQNTGKTGDAEQSVSVEHREDRCC